MKEILICCIVITYYTGTVQIMIIVSWRVHCVIGQIRATILENPSVSVFREKTSAPQFSQSRWQCVPPKIGTYTPNYMLPPSGILHSHLQDNLKSPTSLSYCSFHALQIIYKSLQYQQKHISTIKLTAINTVCFSNMIPAP